MQEHPDTPRLLVMGDIHGRFQHMKEALQRAHYRPDADKLILLGDLVDRGPDPAHVIDHLVKLRERGADITLVGGNHDLWFVADCHYFRGDARYVGTEPNNMAQYSTKVPVEHYRFMRSMVPYHEEEGMLFVHGGYMPNVSLEEQGGHENFAWNRTLWYSNWRAVEEEDIFSRVFIGHTPVEAPKIQGRVINIDTGAGFFGGFVTVMDARTGEWWKSSRVAGTLASIS